MLAPTTLDLAATASFEPPAGQYRGQWLPLALAASDLAVSERTVERRLARGELLRRTGDDGQVEVWVPLAEPEMWDDLAPDAPLDAPPVAAAIDPRRPWRGAAPGEPISLAAVRLARADSRSARLAPEVARQAPSITLPAAFATQAPDRPDAVSSLVAWVAANWAPAAALIGALPALVLVLGAVAMAGRGWP